LFEIPEKQMHRKFYARDIEKILLEELEDQLSENFGQPSGSTREIEINIGQGLHESFFGTVASRIKNGIGNEKITSLKCTVKQGVGMIFTILISITYELPSCFKPRLVCEYPKNPE
jgi:hypothetical protein